MDSCSPEVAKPLLTEPFLIFVNPASGGGLGLELMNLLHDVPNVHLVQLPAEQDTWSTKYSTILQEPTLRACVAGGDGTVNWVITLFSRVFTEDFRPPLGVIPIGTGNDMSRTLNWGGGVSSRGLRTVGRLMENMESTTRIEEIDLWTVVVHQHGSNETIRHQMINYVSFGVDASITYDFQNIRRNCQPLLCCQCLSKAMFVPAGCLNVFGKRDISEYMTVELTGLNGLHDTTQKLKPVRGEKTLVFMSTPSIYGGVKIWKGEEPISVRDGKVEVILEGGTIKLCLANLGINFSRAYGQVEAVRIDSTEPCFYQIDGESMLMNGPATFHIIKTGSYPFLFAD
jgi:diacylglycerol kinase (ATP)